MQESGWSGEKEQSIPVIGNDSLIIFKKQKMESTGAG